MKKFHGIKIALTLALLAFGSNGWGQGVFNKYAPQPGIQVSTGVDYHNTAAVATDVTTLFGCTTPGQFLNQAGGCTVPAGTGVTSVSQTVPAGFAITGSPVTSSGTLAISYATGQTANRVLATPDGTTGALSLRALVAGDIPPINLGSTANGGVSSATILLGTNGGTSNGFFSVTGPTTALRTFTFPNASATVLTTNAAVTVPQGGTGLATLTANGVILGEGTSNPNFVVMGADTVLRGTASADPVAAAVPNCGSSTTALNYSTSTHAFGCQTLASGGTPGGSTTQMQYNNTGAFGGTSGLTWDSTNGILTNTQATPVIGLNASGAAANTKNWLARLTAGGSWALSTATDAAPQTPVKDALLIGRTTTAVSSIAVGNSSDNPTVSIPGSGAISISGVVTNTTAAQNNFTIATSTAGNLAQLIVQGSTALAEGGLCTSTTAAICQSNEAANDVNLFHTGVLHIGTLAGTNELTQSQTGTLTANGVAFTPTTGTFTMTYTGFTSPPGLTATYDCVGNMCTLVIPGSAVAASNATTLAGGTLPGNIVPSKTQFFILPSLCEDNGVIGGFTCSVSIDNSGNITFQKNNSNSGWTNSGQKGVTANFVISYILN